MSTPATEKQIDYLRSLLDRYHNVSGEEAGNTLARLRLLDREHRWDEMPESGSESAYPLYQAIYAAILAEVTPAAEDLASLDRNAASNLITAAERGLSQLCGNHFGNRHFVLLPEKAKELRGVTRRVVDSWLAAQA